MRAGAGQGVEFPIRPALARTVPTLPTGPGWHFEIKLDGSPDTWLCLMRSGGVRKGEA